ncbi:MAG: ABC transporter substrate-binding protein [Candidatus Marinarcus sp.]|uniref:ABC transporter substrate-binding protein n=1 Tax=Candidatus Marinarcus sp. TaxID=3100987 RepID=UPI003AFF6C10
MSLIVLQTLLLSHNNELKVQLRWYHQFQFAGYYAALEKGFYNNAGLDIKLLEGGPSVDSVNAVISKQADFGISNSSLVLEYFNGKPIVNLGVIMQHSPNVLLTFDKYKSPVDLVGSGAIALMGKNQDIELKAMFLKEGIDLNKINFVPNKKHLEDLLNHKVIAVNAYSSNEPYILKSKNIPYKILEPRHYGLDFYGDTLFATQDFVQNNLQSVEKFRQATFKGWEYALKHQDEIIELILTKYNTQNKTKKQLQFEAEVLTKLINPDFVQIGHSNPGRWEHIIQTYGLFGLIKGKKDLTNFYYKPNYAVDLTRFYIYIALTLSVALALAGIAFYIYLTNKKIKKSLTRQTILFENSASAGIVWKKDFTLTGWNTQSQKLFGWTKEEVMGKNIFEFLIPTDAKNEVKQNLLSIQQNGTLYLFTNLNLTKENRIIKCEWHNTLLPKIENEEQEIVSQAIDITKRDLAEKLLKKQAHHDPLTMLPNRHYFEELLKNMLIESKMKNENIIVGFIDLDKFKDINDTIGHEAGDFLLKTLAKQFLHTVDAYGAIARIGGDEFVFYLHNLNSWKNIIVQLLQDASSVVAYDNYTIQVSASIGIYTVQAAYHESMSDILKKADTAMYNAKKLGKNRYCFFDSL